MGRTLATLVAVVLLLGTLGTARAERDLADAVSLAITEATNLEQEIAAGVIKGTKQARWLRRGKEKLAEDLLAQYANMTDTGKRAVAALFAYEAAAKARKLTRLAASKGFAGPCVLTEPAIPQVGGGTWQVSVDGAPAVTLRGESFVDAFSADERSFGIGSDPHAAPYISFYLVGPITTHPGTYPVERPPADEVDEYNRAIRTRSGSSAAGPGSSQPARSPSRRSASGTRRGSVGSTARSR